MGMSGACAVDGRACVTRVRRYLCEVGAARPLCADGSGPEVLVKVERPQRSEDEGP